MRCLVWNIVLLDNVQYKSYWVLRKGMAQHSKGMAQQGIGNVN